MACDMPESCGFPYLENQKRFLWAQKEGDLALQVTGLVLQVGDAKKFPQALGFESLDLFLRVSKQGLCFTDTEENGSDKRLELACEADVVLPDPV